MAHDDHERPNPPRRGLRKGLYLIPSMFTAANIGMGFYSVMASLRGFQLLGSATPDLAGAAVHFDSAAVAIGWALLFDMVDGRIARMTKTTTEIGIQLDSIADVVTFGLAPAVLAYVWGYGASLAEGSDLHRLAWFLSFMYLICGAFRLARFNVQASRPRILAEGTPKVDKKNFVGLPIPVAGGLIASLVHFSPWPLTYFGPERARIYAGLLMVLVGLLSLMMVSTLRFSSFKTIGTQTRSMRTIILALSVGMLIFLYSQYVLLAIVIAYILHGLISRLASIFWRRSDSAEAKIEPNPRSSHN
ncbi:MAG TPA: phosphatidylcholine/phosphatidylserine synthase [Pyrinomonadaceae bacterium]